MHGDLNYGDNSAICKLKGNEDNSALIKLQECHMGCVVAWTYNSSVEHQHPPEPIPSQQHL